MPEEKQPRTWVRRFTGVGAMVASPVYGFAFPLAAIPAVAMLFVKPLAGFPKLTKAIAWWSAIGIVALTLSAFLQDEPVSGNILHYAAMLLFVIAGVKMTSDASTAAKLLAYVSIGSAMFYLIFRPTNTDTFEHLWKYGLGPYVAIAIVWFLCERTDQRIIPLTALFVVGCSSLFLGFRSHGLVCFVVVVIILVRGDTRGAAGKAFKGAVAAVALYALSKVLPMGIAAGWFGQAVQARTMQQLGDNGPDILAGRVEPPLSLAAILKHPWIGWGNLNAIDNHTMSVGADIAYTLGMVPDDYMRLWIRADGRVSLHSVFAEGWAEGGILAVVMPALLFGLFVVAIFKAHGRLAPLVVLVAIQGIWDVLFSTWGYNRGLTLAVSAVLAAWAITHSSQDQSGVAHGGRFIEPEKPGLSRTSSSRHE